MNATVAFAVGVVRTWVALYTLGLPRKLREARRIEIDCDLWEQRQLAGYMREPPFGTAVEILARAALGIFSDITWRVQAGLSARSDRSIKMNGSLVMRGVFFLALAVAVAPAGFGVSVMAGNGEWDSATERITVASLWIAAALTMAAGLALSTSRPAAGIGLLVAGVIAISALWYWIAMITIPIGIALVAIAYFRARGTGWPHGAGTV